MEVMVGRRCARRGTDDEGCRAVGRYPTRSRSGKQVWPNNDCMCLILFLITLNVGLSSPYECGTKRIKVSSRIEGAKKLFLIPSLGKQ